MQGSKGKLALDSLWQGVRKLWLPCGKWYEIPQTAALNITESEMLSWLHCLPSCCFLVGAFMHESANINTSQSFSESLRDFPLRWLHEIFSQRKASERESRCAHWKLSASSAPPSCGDVCWALATSETLRAELLSPRECHSTGFAAVWIRAPGGFGKQGHASLSALPVLNASPPGD